MVWATASSRSCFFSLYRASLLGFNVLLLLPLNSCFFKLEAPHFHYVLDPLNFVSSPDSSRTVPLDQAWMPADPRHPAAPEAQCLWDTRYGGGTFSWRKGKTEMEFWFVLGFTHHIEFTRKWIHLIKLNLAGNSQVKISASGGDGRQGQREEGSKERGKLSSVTMKWSIRITSLSFMRYVGCEI